MEILYIPRDPTTTEIIFLTSIPDKLTKTINETKWSEYMAGLNKTIQEAHEISFVSFLSNFLIIPSLFIKSHRLDERIKEYLNDWNSLFMKKGIYVCHPSSSQYLELRVVVFK